MAKRRADDVDCTGVTSDKSYRRRTGQRISRSLQIHAAATVELHRAPGEKRQRPHALKLSVRPDCKPAWVHQDQIALLGPEINRTIQHGRLAAGHAGQNPFLVGTQFAESQAVAPSQFQLGQAVVDILALTQAVRTVDHATGNVRRITQGIVDRYRRLLGLAKRGIDAANPAIGQQHCPRGIDLGCAGVTTAANRGVDHARLHHQRTALDENVVAVHSRINRVHPDGGQLRILNCYRVGTA